jgi:hypothetical protein
MQNTKKKSEQLVKDVTRPEDSKSWHAPQLIVAIETENSSLTTTDANPVLAS